MHTNSKPPQNVPANNFSLFKVQFRKKEHIKDKLIQFQCNTPVDSFFPGFSTKVCWGNLSVCLGVCVAVPSPKNDSFGAPWGVMWWIAHQRHTHNMELNELEYINLKNEVYCMSTIDMGVHIPADNSEGERCSPIWHRLSVPFESWVGTTFVCFLFVSADFLLPLRISDILGSDFPYSPDVLVPVEMNRVVLAFQLLMRKAYDNE